VYAFNASAGVAITADQMSNLSTGFSGGCSNLRFILLTNVPAAALEGWQPACVASASEYVFQSADSALLQRIPPSAWSGVTSAQVGKINASVVIALSAAQIATMKKNCYGFLSSQISNIAAPLFSNFTKECVGSIDFYVWAHITFDQFSALHPETLADLDNYGMISQ
jgi:hypothetical protein